MRRIADHEGNVLKTDNMSLIRQNGHFRAKIKYAVTDVVCLFARLRAYKGGISETKKKSFKRKDPADWSCCMKSRSSSSRFRYCRRVRCANRAVNNPGSNPANLVCDDEWGFCTGSGARGMPPRERQFAEQNSGAGDLSGACKIPTGFIERETLCLTIVNAWWL